MSSTAPQTTRTTGNNHKRAGVLMNPRFHKVAILMSLAMVGVSPAAMAQAQTATVA